jgi:hypothetical protein
MESLEVGPWVIEVDREATEAAYAEIIDGAEECDCGHCQHWALHRDEFITQPIREWLASLGVDYRREGEVYELNPSVESHRCAGWFHLIGRVVSGPPREIEEHRDGTTTIHMSEQATIVPGYAVIPHDMYAPMKPAIQSAADRGMPILTLDFDTTLHRITELFPPSAVYVVHPDGRIEQTDKLPESSSR